MVKNVAIFLFSFVIAFGVGYTYYHSGGKATNAAADQGKQKQEQPKEQAKASEPAKAAEPAKATAATSKEGEIFTQRGCIQCHSISALGIKAGQVGPDLSKAYTTVADKHGQPLESFLKKPDSAVMSGVLGSKPLTDEERKAVIDALKLASEK